MSGVPLPSADGLGFLSGNLMDGKQWPIQAVNVTNTTDQNLILNYKHLVFLIFDGYYTKMVANDDVGTAKYYVGQINAYNPENWMKYDSAGVRADGKYMATILPKVDGFIQGNWQPPPLPITRVSVTNTTDPNLIAQRKNLVFIGHDGTYAKMVASDDNGTAKYIQGPINWYQPKDYSHYGGAGGKADGNYKVTIRSMTNPLDPLIAAAKAKAAADSTNPNCNVNERTLPTKALDQTVGFNIRGRYVRVLVSDTQGDGCINISQVAVYDINGNNIALGKATSASGTPGWSPGPQVVVDGNMTPRGWGGATGGVWHSEQKRDSFWQVDLGSVQMIKSVRILGRADCCNDNILDRITGTRIRVLQNITDPIVTGTCVISDAKAAADVAAAKAAANAAAAELVASGARVKAAANAAAAKAAADAAAAAAAAAAAKAAANAAAAKAKSNANAATAKAAANAKAASDKAAANAAKAASDKVAADAAKAAADKAAANAKAATNAKASAPRPLINSLKASAIATRNGMNPDKLKANMDTLINRVLQLGGSKKKVTRKKKIVRKKRKSGRKTRDRR